LIVSHEHKFIFLRTEKTAGTSLSSALSKQLGPDDVIYRPFRGNWTKFVPVPLGGLKRHAPQVFGLHFHAQARHVRTVLGKKVFDGYFKFAVERNPWERQVSLYFHRAKKRGMADPDFNRDMNSPLYRLKHLTRLSNWSMYAIDDTIVADQVLMYDQLETGLPELSKKLGLPDQLQMPRLNSGFRDRSQHYSTLYSPQTRDLVASWYPREISALGFEFEAPERHQKPVTAAGSAI